MDLNVSQQLYQDVVHVMQDAMMKSCQGQSVDLTDTSGFVESVLGQLTTDTTPESNAQLVVGYLESRGILAPA